jgi:DNA-binding CsgD family transcriptional regulator/tetratricopeptide (TPR) repeat protein
VCRRPGAAYDGGVAAAESSAAPVGRAGERAALREPVAALAAGRGGVAWIEGEPGIGKSTLIATALADARARGCRVYRAVGDALGQRLPLHPLTEALGRELAGDVAALLDAGDARGQVDESGAVPAAVERLLTVVDRLCAAAPVVLAFDDLQWADEASILAWHRLSLAVDQIPLLLLSACRPVPVRPAVAGLRRSVVDHGGLVLALGPLGDAEVTRLLGQLAGGTPGPRLRRTVARAGGNPLYTRELVDALRREGRIQVESGRAELVGTGSGAPSALAAAIRDRLNFLSRDATAVLRVAALLGPNFSVFDLATATSRPASTLLPVLDEALAAGVLAEAGNRLEFRHGLIRQALYEATPATDRAALHRQVARAVADAGLPLDQVAAHLLAIAPEGLDRWALAWLGEHATKLAHRAPDLAADLLGAVVGPGLTGPGEARRRAGLLHGLAQSLDVLNRLDEAVAAATRALADAADPEQAAEIVWTLSGILTAAGRYGETLPVIDEALARPGMPVRWQARLRATRAKVLAGTGRNAEAETEALAAIDEGERLDDPLAVGYARQVVYLVSGIEPGLVQVEQALKTIGQDPATVGLRIKLLSNRADALEELGHLDAAGVAMHEAMVLAEKVGTWRLPMVRVQLGLHYLQTGSWDDAWAELEPATGKFGLFERLTRLGCLAYITAHRDERAACARLLHQTKDLPELSGYQRGNAAYLDMARAVQAEQRGGPAAAVAALAGTTAIEDEADLFNRCLWLPDLVRLALTVGDTGLARAAVVTADADAKVQPLPRRLAAARRARAVLDGDAATLLDLADQYRHSRSPLAAGQSAEEAAVLLARAGDRPGARGAAGVAVAAYREVGADWDIRRADARLRQYGVRRGPQARHRRPATGWGALTPTEARIAALVGQGRSNPDIAADLLLSRRTVQTHVSGILAKLGYASRVEIVRAAARRGPGGAAVAP